MLEIRNLSAGYRNEEILHNVSFHAENSEFIALLGPNGAGKSTLLKAIMGFLPASEGAINIKGKNLNAWSRKQLASKIAFIPQEAYQQFQFQVEEIVLMGRFPYLNVLQRYSKEDYRVVNEILDTFDLLSLKDRYLNELSGGERQRVFLARAIAQNTDILLLDETFSQLDINHQVELMRLLHTIHKETGKLIILVSHNINLTANFCDRIILLKSGKIIADGNSAEIINSDTLGKAYDMQFEIATNSITKRPNLIYPGINE